jgi:hypothetical protein
MLTFEKRFHAFSELVNVGRILLEEDEAIADIQMQLIEYFRPFTEQKEQLRMKLFQEQNGFLPENDDAKRQLIDNTCQSMGIPCPATDEERNQLVESDPPTEWTEMMKIGWRSLSFHY